MEKININYELSCLKDEYNKALKEFQELLLIFNPHCTGEINFENATKNLDERILDTRNDNLFFDVLNLYKYLSRIYKRIKELEMLKEYNDQIADCYLSYTTQQDIISMMNDADKDNECYQTYIPDEVETGYFESEEDRIKAEQINACYNAHLTKQENDEISDRIDASVAKYATYIPEEVETGINIDSLKRLAESAESLEKEIYGDEEHIPNRMLLPEPVNGVTSFPITRSRNQ